MNTEPPQTGDNPYADQPYQTPTPVDPAPMPTTAKGDETGGVIPYKNPHALFAYYLGLFSLFPVLGLFLAVPAFMLGISGLRKRNANPVIKGSVHAWIGIVLGGIFSLVWGFAVLAILIGLLAAQ